MKINRQWIALGLVASVLASTMSVAYADAEKSIPVNANLGVAIDMIDAGGGAMGTAAQLQWDGVRFSTWAEQVVITSNNRAKGAVLKLLDTPQLTYGSNTPIPLIVKLGGNVLSTVAMTFSSATLFGGVAQGAGNSLPMKLSIDANPTQPPSTGTWTGLVRLSLAQEA